jgi:hypothetical protein
LKRSLALLGACALVLTALIGNAPAQSGPTNLEHLNPGAKANLDEQVPVNVVFLGYTPAQVDAATFSGVLPAVYRPIVRSRLFYGIRDYLGIRYTYDYKLEFASSNYENRFFSRLSSLAEPAPLTDYQKAYNEQKSNVLDVRDNHHIDAPSVEQWLATNPPQGIDTSENTIFLVNWWGRDDFVHHVYTKTNEPDPDTGYNFGVQNPNRKIIAWGGTPASDEEDGYGGEPRVWFYDLSAGPEAWTDNWNVDQLDLDGDGKTDYRMPPIWEYRRGGFRAPTALSRDLGLVARYVGIDLLFTTSPSFPPDLTPPALPSSIDLDSNTYEEWPGVDASQRYITEGLLVDELGELQPTASYSFDNQDLVFAGGSGRCYVLWLQERRCKPRYAYPAFANLFLYNALEKWPRLQDDQDKVDYEAGLFNYATREEISAPILGFAGENYRDGTQSFVFSFVSPGIAAFGYGLTTTQIHEVGHHVGMSHPHDGFDYETRTNFYPSNRFYFAWSGNENNSIMSYIDLNWDFSQFDQDNMARFLTAEYITNANLITARILARGDSGAAADELGGADRLVGRAAERFGGHDYAGAAEAAADAYSLVLKAAEDAGVTVEGTTTGTDVDEPVPRSVRDRSKPLFVDRLSDHRPRG